MVTTVEAEQRRLVHVRMVVVAVALLALTAVALTAPAMAGRAMAAPADDAGASVGLLNQARADRGLPALTPDPELQAVADRQAGRMAESGAIFHTSNLGDQISWGWWGWAENVGYGPSTGWIHNAFMNSSTHASHILDPSYNYVGVGVAYGSDGNVYVAQIFGAW